MTVFPSIRQYALYGVSLGENMINGYIMCVISDLLLVSSRILGLFAMSKSNAVLLINDRFTISHIPSEQ